MKYFIANWKANKNLAEAIKWLDTFLTFPISSDYSKVVICPPHPLLYPVKEKIKNAKNIYLGAQDLSSFGEGSYTGEVSAKTLSGMVDYVIIGHSERRKNFNENDELLLKKTHLAKQFRIEPIFCVRDENDKIPQEVQFIAYEPIFAIGSGDNQPVQKVLEVKQKLQLPKQSFFLYGGSANKNNASSYLASPEINGFLVGTASLDPLEFYRTLAQE